MIYNCIYIFNTRITNRPARKRRAFISIIRFNNTCAKSVFTKLITVKYSNIALKLLAYIKAVNKYGCNILSHTVTKRFLFNNRRKCYKLVKSHTVFFAIISPFIADFTVECFKHCCHNIFCITVFRQIICCRKQKAFKLISNIFTHICFV